MVLRNLSHAQSRKYNNNKKDCHKKILTYAAPSLHIPNHYSTNTLTGKKLSYLPTSRMWTMVHFNVRITNASFMDTEFKFTSNSEFEHTQKIDILWVLHIIWPTKYRNIRSTTFLEKYFIRESEKPIIQHNWLSSSLNNILGMDALHHKSSFWTCRLGEARR